MTEIADQPGLRAAEQEERAMGLKDEMPVLMRAIGRWQGTYCWVDPSGNRIDQHESLLTCSLVERDGEERYHQSNDYRWPDGRSEHIEFPATYAERAIWFDTERIKGKAWEVDGSTIILTWVRKDDPTGWFYEMINFTDDDHKYRTWQFFKGGLLERRCLINEERVR
jgi:hypothetical protein